jgi:hypothetical protein
MKQKENRTLKQMMRTFPLLFVLLFGAVHCTNAQNASAYLGFGTATASSSGQGIDTFGTGTPFYTPRMGGLFATLGGDYMFRPHLGFGAEASWRVRQGSYAGLNYRPSFYDFNVIWQPITASKRVVPAFQGGLGGVKLSFYNNQQSCNAFTGCSTSSGLLAASSHFQLHFAGGVRFYVKPNIFIRPQVDVHWVDNFFQFGSSVVPQYSIAIGYTFGR